MHIHTWTIGSKNFGGHNGALMQALWIGKMVVAHQIFNNEAHKVMSRKTLMATLLLQPWSKSKSLQMGATGTQDMH
jgi:hypothetical protein